MYEQANSHTALITGLLRAKWRDPDLTVEKHPLQPFSHTRSTIIKTVKIVRENQNLFFKGVLINLKGHTLCVLVTLYKFGLVGFGFTLQFSEWTRELCYDPSSRMWVE